MQTVHSLVSVHLSRYPSIHFRPDQMTFKCSCFFSFQSLPAPDHNGEMQEHRRTTVYDDDEDDKDKLLGMYLIASVLCWLSCCSPCKLRLLV